MCQGLYRFFYFLIVLSYYIYCSWARNWEHIIYKFVFSDILYKRPFMIEDILSDFQNFLISRGFADKKHAPFYAHWVSKFIAFSNNEVSPYFSEKRRKFLEQLSGSPGIADWQKNQAETALKLYFEQFDRNAAKLDSNSTLSQVNDRYDPVSIINAMSKAIR